MNKVGFIGTGNMAMAMISGIFKSRMGMRLMAYDIHSNNYEQLLQHGVVTCTSAAEVVKRCDYVVIAVKPQNYQEVLEDIRTSLGQDTILISIAAGINEHYVAKQVGFIPKFVQVMPNTPLLLGAGATALAKGSRTSEEEFAFVESIFSLSGTTAEVPASLMNEIIAINGSSPAFIYLFAKAFLDYARKEGIDEQAVLKLFCASLRGSADMMENSGKSVDELIRLVSSPGGTTLAGLAELEKGKLIETVDNCCKACTKRAYELSR